MINFYFWVHQRNGNDDLSRHRHRHRRRHRHTYRHSLYKLLLSYTVAESLIYCNPLNVNDIKEIRHRHMQI